MVLDLQGCRIHNRNMVMKPNLIFHLKSHPNQKFFVIGYRPFLFGNQFKPPLSDLLEKRIYWLQLDLAEGRAMNVPIDNVAFIETYDDRLGAHSESEPNVKIPDDPDSSWADIQCTDPDDDDTPGHLRS